MTVFLFSQEIRDGMVFSFYQEIGDGIGICQEKTRDTPTCFGVRLRLEMDWLQPKSSRTSSHDADKPLPTTARPRKKR